MAKEGGTGYWDRVEIGKGGVRNSVGAGRGGESDV